MLLSQVAHTVPALLAADPDLAGDIELGASWRRVEAALPEGWAWSAFHAGGFYCKAFMSVDKPKDWVITMMMLTPAAALAALATALEARQP